MKSSDSRLDAHIRETLKNPDYTVPAVDWSEVEVLLSRESEPFSVSLPSVSLPDKKYLIAGGAALVLLIGIILIIRLAGPSSPDSAPAPSSAEPAPQAQRLTPENPAQMPRTDSIKPRSAESVPTIQDEIKTADSLLAIDNDSVGKGKHSEKASAGTAEPKKIEKKSSRLSVLAPGNSDSEPMPENIVPPDTAKPKTPETNKEGASPASSSSDSSKSGPWWKRGKNRKSKDSGKTGKADSLK